MKFAKKLTALLLSALMVVGFVPAFGFAENAAGGVMSEAEKTAKIDELLAFSGKVAEITKQYTAESIAKNNAEYKKNDNAESEKEMQDNTFELARLIVKSKNELDYTGSVAHASGYDNLHIIQYATSKEARRALKKYQTTKGVEYAVPDVMMHIDQQPHENEFMSWGYGSEYVNAFNYTEWLLEKCGDDVANLPEIVVAVIDTGIDFDHEYFGGMAADGGRIKEGGYDFINDDDDPQDDQMHGTHCAGTVCDGTLPNVKILPVKVLAGNGQGSASVVQMGMEYAYLKGCAVASMSLSGSSDGSIDLGAQDTINKGMDAGTVYCLAAGNDSHNAKYNSPANIARACTVAAHDPNGNMAWFSNYGDVVDITAPGVGITSAKLGGGTVDLDGTSMATPHVAAVCALVKSFSPNMPADDVISAVKDNAIPAVFPDDKPGGVGLLCAADMFKFDPYLNGENTYLHYTSDGEYPWHADEKGAWSGNTGTNDSVSVLASSSAFKAYSELTFEYKVSSEENHDMFRFIVNDDVVFSVSGDTGWQTFTYDFPTAGTKTLKWEFTKDAEGAGGEDKAMIRSVQLHETVSSTLNSGKAQFRFGGDWVIDGDSAKSGNQGIDGSVSTLTTAPVQTIPGITFMFSYKVSCGEGDRFQFLVNNRVILDVDQETDWTEYRYAFKDNDEAVFTFKYIKDGSGAAGDDCAWIRKVDFDFTLDTVLNVPGGNLKFSSEVPYPWMVEEDYAKNGNQHIGNSDSAMTLDLTLKEGDTLTFRYRIGCEKNCDWFSFIVNDVYKVHKSGVTPWTEYTFTAPEDGDYSFMWEFSKDPAGDENGDFAYVDDVQLVTSFIPGDCNEDGNVDLTDALLALRYAMNIIDEIGCFAAADMDGNGIITVTDAVMILRAAMEFGQ